MPLSPVLILVAFGLCLWLGSHLYVRYGGPPLFESVRAGQWHYIVLGAGAVFWLDTLTPAATDQEDILRGILGVGLVWIGFRVGLDLDLRQLQQVGIRPLCRGIVRWLASFGLLAACFAFLLPEFGPSLGIEGSVGLVVLLISAAGLSAREAGFFSLRTGRPTRNPSSLSIYANAVAVLFVGLGFPLFPAERLYRIGSFHIVGYGQLLAMMVFLGLLLGITVDFVFRAHRNAQRCIFLTVAACAVVAGPCLHLDLPPIAAGFLAGVWVINTTVRKREIAETTEFAASIVEPLILVAFGALLAAPVSPKVVTLVAVSFLVLRSFCRFASLSVEAWLTGATRVDLPQAWLPLGRISVALVAHLMLLPAPAPGNVLTVALLLAATLSQTVVLPTREPLPAPKRNGAHAT